MIDARRWRRPSNAEVRALIHGLRDGRSVEDTAAEVGARLGVARRRVYYWMSDPPKRGREIGYCEWTALKSLAEESAKRASTGHVAEPNGL